MAEYNYSDDELKEYFSDPNRRRSQVRRARTPIGRFWQDRFGSSRKSRAFTFLSYIVLAGFLVITFLGGYLLTLVDELPSMQSIENPDFQLATIAYTADGEELARYARQNRSWVTYDEISPHVINALWATEDHRFYAHWGIDLFGTMTAVPLSILKGDPRGASSISQQLARNLYNEEIGRRVTVARKLKEMVTAVQLERRYTKAEIIEMYLNTVDFGSQTYGIEAAARKYFGKTPLELNELEGATLVGMLKATTTYNPLVNPENARQRRNVVLSQMIKHDVISPAFYEEHKEDSVKTSYRSAAITESLAPHFAEEVRKQAQLWAEQNDLDIYEDGLVIYTTLDSRMQNMAMAVADSLMPCLERVAAHEWSRDVVVDSTGAINTIGYSSTEPCDYMDYDFEPWSEFWRSQPSIINQTIRETGRYRSLVRSGTSGADAIADLRDNQAFMDSLKAVKTRLELGFVAMDPGTGHVRTWIGGTDLEEDWYDHVATAARQPGSTFKPFVYTAAIDEGWNPYYTLMDDSLNWVDDLGNVWNPSNSGRFSGQMTTLREGLAQSLNSITARLMIEVGPPHVAFYARRMGIKSPLDEVPALALGTSDVTLLEMTTAYSTFANGGLLYEPVVITQIQDRSGNILYESESVPKEALSEATAYTMIDMMRAVVQPGAGHTGQRVRTQYGLWNYDLAGKTGTTQYSADNWFMLMHPDLVVGSWVGFNDPRFRFRTDFWGQGAHTALHLVGNYMVRLTQAEDTYISPQSRFPAPQVYGANYARNPNPPADSVRAGRRGGVAW